MKKQPGGPNDWQEAGAGLKRRKARLNQRNAQIRDLKFRLDLAIKALNIANMKCDMLNSQYKALEKLADMHWQRFAATRKVALHYLLELTEDGHDMTGEEMENEVDNQINTQIKILNSSQTKETLI